MVGTMMPSTLTGRPSCAPIARQPGLLQAAQRDGGGGVAGQDDQVAALVEQPLAAGAGQVDDLLAARGRRRACWPGRRGRRSRRSGSRSTRAWWTVRPPIAGIEHADRHAPALALGRGGVHGRAASQAAAPAPATDRAPGSTTSSMTSAALMVAPGGPAISMPSARAEAAGDEIGGRAGRTWRLRSRCPGWSAQ